MFQKVTSQRFICALKFYFEGDFRIFNLTESPPELSQRFYETIHAGSYDQSDPYFSKGSFNFSENSNESESGVFYKQQATFRFPSNDVKRAARIEELRKIKYLGLILNDGTEFIMGRNDIYQNRKPETQTSSTFHMTEVKIMTESIQPIIQIHSEDDGDGGGEPLLGYDYTYDFELS